MKIYELAKEYGEKATDFLKKVNEAGVEKKSHLNVLTEQEIAIVRAKMSNKSNNNNNTNNNNNNV